MKFRYAITYAKLSPDVSGTEAVKEAFGDHVKEAERHGLKVPFWARAQTRAYPIFPFSLNIQMLVRARSELTKDSEK
jgi:hypothetical protein